MKRKLAVICLSIVMLFNIILILTDITIQVSGNVVNVGGVGPGNYSTIQAGINAANPGDTVFVYSGTYVENVAISKRINLEGEDRFTTRIDGNSITDTVTINADRVNVSGFTITGGNPFGVFLQVNSENNTIEDCIITGNDNSGIEIYGYSHFNTIANNTITGNSMAGVVIHSKCDHNVVTGNFIDDNNLRGIIITNPFDDYPNENNRISGNTINNSEIGIYLYNINHRNILENNTVNHTDYGISLYISNTNNTINGNTLSNSSICGMYLLDLNENNIIYHNNFVNNAFHAFDNGANYWNLSYPQGGNFWDDYSGGDNRSGPLQDIYGNDAFGDEKYGIAGGVNEDSYPLWPNWNALQFYEPFPIETDVCEYAMGNVKVAVIFVESNGSIDPESEDWTAPRQATVLSEIQDALSWWESLEANASLNLSIEVIGSRNTSYEPITHVSSDDELWIGEIMADMGFTEGIFLQQVMSFNHWLRQQHGTDWAYTIFVVDSLNDADGCFADPPTCAYSYMTASCIVMTYDNDGYGIAKMNNVTAHETGHMFYATDEYKNPGETSGYLNATEVDDSGCLMDDNTLVLSSGTELQIGWRDADSDGIMDILDTEPNTYLIPYEPDPTYETTPSYMGYAVVVPYPNENPNGFGRDVTLNTISGVHYRIDNGTWENATAADGDFDEPVETFQFTTTQLSPGIHFIETRAVNSVNNSDPTYANDTIMILGDYDAPEIWETTTDVPVAGDSYNVTAVATDNVGVASVWFNYTVTSSDGHSETHNISMIHSSGDSYWCEIEIWDNATWFNYSIAASDPSGNWNTTSIVNLNFRVHNLDTGEGFLEIQTAIDDFDTVDGHTIFVEKGIYYENVVLYKSINLTGEDRDGTEIDGGGVGDVVHISVNWVNVSGFTVTGNGLTIDSYKIELQSVSNCWIHNNYLYWSGSGNGINVGFSNNNKISDNVLASNRIYLYYADDNNITNNNLNNNYIQLRFSDNNDITKNYVKNTNGIYLEDSHWNNITENNVTDNSYGIYLSQSNWNNISKNYGINNSEGVYLYYSTGNDVISNNFSHSKYAALYVDNSDANNLTGNNASDCDYGIYLWYSNGNSINRSEADDNYWYGIYLISSYDAIIDSNNASGNQKGIYLSSSPNGIVSRNNASSNDQTGILLEDSNSTTVILNTASDCNSGIYINSDNCDIIGNIVHSNDESGIILSSANGNNVLNNNITQKHTWGIRVANALRNDIIGNNISFNMHGIYFQTSSDNNVQNNNISFNTDTGITISSSNSLFISGNIMINDGIFIRGGSIDDWNTHTIGTSNTVNGNPVYYLKNQTGVAIPSPAGQIILANCSNIEITDKELSNTTVGIEIGFSSNINVSGNNLNYNYYGIYLTYSEWNLVTENNISNNYWGFWLEETSNNSLYHNNIINNTFQAMDLWGINYWDNGYPSGGNYWSDYTGNDTFKGPNQDIPGSDGIGDINYTIDSDSIDHYPLITPYPYENYIILFEGWNLISIPLIQSEQNLSRVLGSIDGSYDSVQWYNPTDISDRWKHNKIGKPFGNDLYSINETMGFWIHITKPGETMLLYNGTQLTFNQTITLYEGWNMVGFPSISNKTRDAALNNLFFDTEVDAIWTFDAATQTWQEVGPGDDFVIGRGYWVHVTQECEWEVPL